MEEDSTLRRGTVLRNGKYAYRIESVLGRGSFGITYLASMTVRLSGGLGNMNAEVKVAVKEFFMSEVNSRTPDGSSVGGSTGSVFVNYRRKFRKEAENLSHLDHPHIVKVLDVFDENDTSYYVMQYVAGESLDEYIRAEGRLTLAETLRLAGQIGSALSYMHAHRMLHLDLKPKNVMLDGDRANAYLIDFGLSKQYDESGEPESSTTIGLGTPGYAPIEQANYRPEGTFPATLDVYALGATLFKMLTGERPPVASTILNEGFPTERLAAAAADERMMRVIERAMAPQRKNRYPDVNALLQELDTDAGAAPMPDVNAPAPETGKTSAAAEAAEPGNPAAPRTDDTEKTLPSGAAPATPPTPADKKKGWLWGIVGAVVVVAALFGIGTLLNRGGNANPALADSLAVADTLALVDSLPAPAADPSASAPAEPAAEQEYGALKIESTPAGAAIWLDGKNTKKTTPELFEEVAPGSHKVVLKLDGHADAAKSVTVKPDERTTCTLTLKETAQPTPAQTAQVQAQPQPAPAPAQTQPQAQTPAPAPAASSKWTKTKNGNKTTYSNGEVSFTMVAVAGGTFMMGANRSDSWAEKTEKPAHSVTVSGFSIGETEVTQALWQAVMGSNPDPGEINKQCPVAYVTYYDCKTFISRLNSLTGENFRFPTEAEWEFAARGGNHSQGYQYSGSNDLYEVAWYKGNCKSAYHPVKTKSPNELGLYDMTGNLWEWCYDWYGDYNRKSQTNPRGPQSGFYRVIRGASWYNEFTDSRVSVRESYSPDSRHNNLGLRLAQ